jgi:hypothetical protein
MWFGAIVDDGALIMLGTVGLITLELVAELDFIELAAPVIPSKPADVAWLAQPYGQEAVIVGRVTTETGAVAVRLEPAVTVTVGRVTIEGIEVLLLANGTDTGSPEIEALWELEMLAIEVLLVLMVVAVWLPKKPEAVGTAEGAVPVPWLVAVLLLYIPVADETMEEVTPVPLATVEEETEVIRPVPLIVAVMFP